MKRRVIDVLAVVATLGLASCADPDPATQILVVFEADRAVRQVAEQIVITATGGPRGQAIPSMNTTDLQLPIEDIGGWPVTHTIAPTDNDATRIYLIEGTVLNAREEPVAHVRAVSGYVDRRSLVLRLRFYANCLYQDACEADDESCDVNGDCRRNRIAPDGLADLPDAGIGALPDAGMEPLCRTALDCDDGVACTIDSCTDEGCISRAEDALCTADGMSNPRCDPVAGCQYGALGTCVEGDNCVAEDCEARVECIDDVCVRTWACDFAQGCCGGVCQTCADTNPCTDGACDDVAGACTTVPADGDCDNGVFCDGSEQCVAGECTSPGDPCPGLSSCDAASDACTGCAGDADCPIAFNTPMSPTCERDPSAPFCSDAGIANQMRFSYTCNAGTCEENAEPISMSCMVTPSREGAGCRTGTSTPVGECYEPMGGDPCDGEGEQGTASSVFECAGRECVNSGSMGTGTVDCPLPIPGACRTPDASLPDATTDSMFDAGFDSSPDTAFDSSLDTGFDTGMDTGSDTGSDTGMDTGTPPPDTSIPRDTGMDTSDSGSPDTGTSDASTGDGKVTVDF